MTQLSTRRYPPPLPLALDLGAELPISLESWELATPALLIDLDVMQKNIASMASLTARRGLRLRPHVKSHKSTYIVDQQLAAGASGVCVATVGEAEVMWGHGIADILVAYPILGERKLRRLLPLAEAGDLTLTTDSLEVAEGYSRLAGWAGRDIPILLDIDSGMGRTGVLPSEAATIGPKISALAGLDFRGILTHAGHAHDAKDQSSIELVARQEVRAMAEAYEGLEQGGLEVSVVSAGSTITTPYLSAEDGITEVRPGTYIFNDLRTLGRYACTPDSIAVSMLATVVSRGPGRATIDAGSKSLTSSQTVEHGFGHLLGHPEAYFERLSEEHGVLAVGTVDELSVGDRVQVVPIHVCVWMDLQSEVYGTSQGEVVKRISVDGMRRSL